MLIFLSFFVLSFHLKEELLKNDSVQIFIIDSKVNSAFLNSPALKIQPDSSHGSKVAAVIRSQSRADITAFSSENIIGRIDKNNYLASLKEVKNYAEIHPQEKVIVNISLGFKEKEFQQKIINEINELENIILIAAAGNNNSDQISYPAKFEKVIAVAALENNGKMPGSNYGQEIDFAASGIIEITQRHHLPALNFSRKYKLTGTSFAAPQVTALVADIVALNPELKLENALAIISATSQKLDIPLFEAGKMGAGSINRFKARSKANPYYFWLQIALYISLSLTTLFFLYFYWQKYSLSGIFIFLIISVTVFLMQPFFMLLYYQFGLFKIIFFFLSLGAFYAVVLKLFMIYLKNSSNYSLLLKIGPHLNDKMQEQLKQKIKKILAQNNKDQNGKLNKIIISSLRQSYSQKKIQFYLLHTAVLEQPPIELIVEKLLNYEIPAKITASNFNFSNRNQREQSIIIAELLVVIFNQDYSKKKNAAEIAAELNSALMLIPIKNTLKNRSEMEVAPVTLYFLLDIVSSFGSRAADFSPLLKEIISQESNPWLKYHALQAYQEVGANDSDYEDFLTEIKQKEKEPVLLALKIN